MAHTFKNILFTYGDGIPAKLIGIEQPFSYPNGSTLILKVNGIQYSTNLPNGATTPAGIAANVLANMTLVVTESPSGNLEISTQETGETASIEVVGGTAVAYLRLHGTVYGVTYPEAPQDWSFDGTQNDEEFWERFTFDTPSPYVETWGVVIEGDQAFSDYFYFGTTPDFIENFGGWNPGDPLTASDGVFTGLTFLDPPQFEVVSGPDIEPPIGSPLQITTDPLTFERWYIPVLSVVDPTNGDDFVFNMALDLIENWSDIIDDIGTINKFEFENQAGGAAVFIEKMPRVLQGDVLVECLAGAAADTILHLVLYNTESGEDITDAVGQTKFTVKAARLDGTATTLATAFTNAINHSSKVIRAVKLSASELGGSLVGSSKVYIAVYVIEPAFNSCTSGQQVTPIDVKFVLKDNRLDYSEKVAGFGIAAPETHWHSRNTFRRLS